MKIPIKKHTKVRRPVSRYKVLLNIGSPVLFRNDIDILVSDVYTRLENPLYVGSDFMEAIRNPKITSTYPERIPGTKPSLLTRVKERFKK